MIPMLKNGENTLKSKDGKTGYDLTPFKNSMSQSPLKAAMAHMGKYSKDMEDEAEANLEAGDVEGMVKAMKDKSEGDVPDEEGSYASPEHNEKVASILRSLADMLCPEPEESEKGLMIEIMMGK